MSPQQTSSELARPRYDVTRFTPEDFYLFNEGSHIRLYGKLGAHPHVEKGVRGTHFAVWAPGARQVFLADVATDQSVQIRQVTPAGSSANNDLPAINGDGTRDNGETITLD